MDTFNYILDILFDFIFFAAAGYGIFKLVGYSRKTFRVVRHTGVRFSDIAGMDNLKKEMMFVVDILKNRQKYENQGIRQVKGIILEGVPGNGKTLFAKALAEEADVNFIATKGADFQGAVMSMSAMKVRMLFRKAHRCRPCIIFIDEFDSIGERRNYAGSGIDKENNRMLTTLLNEMDGFTPSDGVLVIAATNSYQSLDPALIRPGRFDLKYTIGNPDAETRLKLVEIYSRGKKFSSDITPQILAAVFEGLSCSAIETVLNESYTLASMAGLSEINATCIFEASQKTGCKLHASLVKKKQS